MSRPAPAHLLGIAALLATGCTDEPGQQQRQPFACNETRDGSRCIEAADGSTWEVGDAAVTPDQTGEQALVAVESLLSCPFERGGRITEGNPVRPFLCEGFVGFDEESFRFVIDELSGDGFRMLTTQYHEHGIVTPFFFPILDGAPLAGSVSSAWLSTCEKEWNSGGDIARRGHLDPLTNGEVRIVSADDTEAIIEIDFPEARGRLRARVCEPW